MPAIVEFAWAAAVAFLSVAAVWALTRRVPSAVPLARAAIVTSGGRALQRLVWTALPADVIPGTRGWLAAVALLVTVALLAASTRVDAATPSTRACGRRRREGVTAFGGGGGVSKDQRRRNACRYGSDVARLCLGLGRGGSGG